MVQVSLDLRYLRIYWVLILYLDFDPCYLREVALRMMIGYSLRYSKVIKYSIEDSPLVIEGGYTLGLL